MSTRHITRLSAVAAFLVLSLAFSVRGDDAKSSDTKAADATGTWTWSVQGFGGQQDVTLKLKQDGEKVTGTISGMQGGQDSEIQDGKFKDGALSFSVVRDFNGQKITTNYTGTISGDGCKGKSETIISRDFDAKRAK